MWLATVLAANLHDPNTVSFCLKADEYEPPDKYCEKTAKVLPFRAYSAMLRAYSKERSWESAGDYFVAEYESQGEKIQINVTRLIGQHLTDHGPDASVRYHGHAVN